MLLERESPGLARRTGIDKNGKPPPFKVSTDGRARRRVSSVIVCIATPTPASRIVVAWIVSLSVLSSRTSHADESTAADIASARRLGFEGITLADKGNCAAAVEKLARAEKLFHAPTTLGRLGECQVQLGRLVEGTENLGRVAREELPTNAPPAFVQARARARKQLAAASPKLARAKISVKGPLDANVTVTVDGTPLPSANLGEDRALDPGSHVVKATAPGFLEASATIVLREGGSEEVTLTLSADPNAVKAAAPLVSETKPARASPGSAPPGAEQAPNRTAAYVVLGVGAVGVGVGAAFGLSALTQKSSLSKACPNDQCHASEQGDLDAAKRAGTVSTIAFGVGGAALLVGGILFFTATGSPRAATAQPGLVARPYTDGSSLGLAGSF